MTDVREPRRDPTGSKNLILTQVRNTIFLAPKVSSSAMFSLLNLNNNMLEKLFD
jgi:hypothetical protein